MLRKAGTLLVAAALGAAASTGVAACGEKRGSVSIEQGPGAKGDGDEGPPTTKAPTETTPTVTARTKTTTTGR